MCGYFRNKNPKQSNFKYNFFCFGNIFNSFKCQVFVITLILMMSGALVGHQKTRTVQKFSFDK